MSPDSCHICQMNSIQAIFTPWIGLFYKRLHTRADVLRILSFPCSFFLIFSHATPANWPNIFISLKFHVPYFQCPSPFTHNKPINQKKLLWWICLNLPWRLVRRCHYQQLLWAQIFQQDPITQVTNAQTSTQLYCNIFAAEQLCAVSARNLISWYSGKSLKLLHQNPISAGAPPDSTG